MSYVYGEQEPHESQDQQTQREKLELMADICLGALDLVEALDRSSLKPSEIEYSVSVPPIDSAVLPDRIRSIGEPLKLLTVSAEKVEDETRVGLDLTFDFEQCSCRITRPTFTPADADFEGMIGPALNANLPGPPGMRGTLTPIRLGVDEISDYLSHAIHEIGYQSVPLTDPQDAEQAAIVIDTLSQRKDAIQTKTTEYDIAIDEDEFTVTVITNKGVLTELTIEQVILEELFVENDELKNVFHRLITKLTLDDLQTGLQFTLHTNEDYISHETPTIDMVQHTRTVIEQLTLWAESHNGIEVVSSSSQEIDNPISDIDRRKRKEDEENRPEK